MRNLFLDEEQESETNREEESSDDSDASESQDPTETSSANTFVAKDGTVWNQLPPDFHQTPAHNVVRQRSGPHQSTETMSVCDTFRCIFTDEMIDIIIRHTNKKAKRVYETYNTNNPTKTQLEWKDLTVREFNLFLGILITSGVNHSNTQYGLDMWKTNSYPLYRASMGYIRFRNILRFIRFDDANTREERQQLDKAAPIRDLWSMLNSNLQKYYRPTENLTIDEQLFPYRGRMKFKQYIPSKPAKYGIKIWWICDAENYYPLTGQIYTGKPSTGRDINQGERVVKELVAPYKGFGRNITTDNFFTTLPLAKHLLSWNLTIVGTLKKNKSYIPQEMAPSNVRQVFSTLLQYTDSKTT
ncbi:PREDICTED: piggyBac transposable element-derived protein 4-like [Cyphomyrmex costatus]|uniref:piggyBac transposable element-derived protein 4-like n=1 Tax=Cyphomyrmex costatus TaxID=456900 RepID=UPI000852212B|nr:PREDICTED: piggyBac transposable element-derived protein 4-like [Cyphomyrmex costatus]